MMPTRKAATSGWLYASTTPWVHSRRRCASMYSSHLRWQLSTAHRFQEAMRSAMVASTMRSTSTSGGSWSASQVM